MSTQTDDFDDDEDFGIDEETGDECCIHCWDTFRYDDCGGYNPPCSCGLHCRSCHEAIECQHDDDLDPDEREADDEDDRATKAFWDGRVGHSGNATDDDELPF